MATVSKSIFIAAPVEKVFAFMDDPMNITETMNDMSNVRNVTDADGFKSFDWTYKMAGMKFDGSSKQVERVPNQHLKVESKGGIESTFVYDFAPDAGGTRVTVLIDYKIPVPVLGKLAENLITRQNEKSMETMMENLKAKVEAQEAVKS